MKTPPLLTAEAVCRHFEIGSSAIKWSRRRRVYAVDGVDIEIHEGESVGLVGESGCGKTTLSRLFLLLLEASSGTIRFKGKDVAQFGRDDHREFRRLVQPVFQDPLTALDGRMRVDHIVAEPLRAMTQSSRSDTANTVGRVLESVGLEAGDAGKYPHEFSGGQRQRIAIARALVLRPKLILLDEPVASQDVSIRAQILNLLQEVRERSEIGYFFISHDLSTVRFLCERVYVMYLGRIVEHGPVQAVYDSPRHPYTQALLRAWLPPDPAAARRAVPVAGEVPSASDPPAGCRFHPRCPSAIARCRTETPRLRRDSAGVEVACHLYAE